MHTLKSFPNKFNYFRNQGAGFWRDGDKGGIVFEIV